MRLGKEAGVIGVAVEVISVCLEMEICPFLRPNRSVHRIVKWVLPRSYLAQRLLPHLDNWVYGRKWKPRAVATWVQYFSTYR